MRKGNARSDKGGGVMKKNDYIEMLVADIQTEDNEGVKKLYEDIIDCV